MEEKEKSREQLIDELMKLQRQILANWKNQKLGISK